MVKELDVAMQHLSDVIFHTTGKDVSLHPGAGAAGGMGGSLHAFLDAQLKPGIELLLETLDFAEKIKDADLIITGEGKSDRQTLMGKYLQASCRKQEGNIFLSSCWQER